MEEKNDVMLPGFRFHPTDEELVGFYLKRKIQHRCLPIELIKQVDIYKYDPWDLPKIATSGEKEWYFYCPRDRKYRNSARPNRVTGAGFWKATGTDRPIYSSEGTKCIGLKKSLVFYRGRAAKGIKTDWMMHEFRLPSLTVTDSPPPNKLFHKNFPANDAWAICRIFKKTNSMAQRALSQSWASQLPERTSDVTQFCSQNVSCTTDLHPTFSDISCYDLFPPDLANNNTSMFSPSNMLLNLNQNNPVFIGDVSKGSCDFQGQQSMSLSLPQQIQGNIIVHDVGTGETQHHNQWGTNCSIRFPFTLPQSDDDAWNPNLPPPCPTPTTYSTNNCYE